jgi:hypothetical protein
MVTNYPEEATVQAVPDTGEEGALRGVMGRTWQRVHHAICGLHGHDPLLQFDNNRVFLRCASCGYETPGWDVGKNRPRLRFGGNAARHTS